ncbi:MAG: type I secretion system permease/ATPase [Proteobacteria bacterium]|nr:type I secretion system permease/ATPase [Pseudomonadota bacterium]
MAIGAPGGARENPLLAQAIEACRKAALAVVLFSFCVNLLLLAAPIYMLQLYDRVLSSRSTETLIVLTLMAVAAILTMAALEVVRGHAMVKISTWLDKRLSGAVLAASIAGSIRSAGDPSVQGLRDLGTFRTFLTGPAVFPIMDAPWTPVFIAVIYLMHPVLGWVALFGAVALFALAVLNELATRRPLERSGAASIKALHGAEAAVRNADVIEAMGMMPNLVRWWQRDNAEMLALQGRASAYAVAIGGVSKFVRLCLQVGMLGTGAWLAVIDLITPGTMIAASIIMSRALAPVEQAIGSWKLVVVARNAYRRMKRQLDEMPLRGQAMPLPAPVGRLAVEGVTFFHPGQQEPTLRNVAFWLDPGEALGLIGPTASGKTTLARLLVGILEARAGHVRLDGVDVARWEPEDLGRHVGYLPQDIELFRGNVRANIARMGEADPEAVVKAARLAGVHEMILALPRGYETEIGEGGARLSGGQRQRLVLARALYGDPRFLVLDEPNANLDAVGEEALLSAIEETKGRGVTMVIIAHRPSILRHVDKILVLRAGQVQTFGPRDEVIAQLTVATSGEGAAGAKAPMRSGRTGGGA